MLGIGGTEFAIILVFAFLVIGPDHLPEMGRTLGRAIRQFREAQEGFTKVVQTEVLDPAAAAGDDPVGAVKRAAGVLTGAEDDSDLDPEEAKRKHQAELDEQAHKLSFAERRAQLAAEREAAEAEASEAAEAEEAAEDQTQADVIPSAEGDSSHSDVILSEAPEGREVEGSPTAAQPQEEPQPAPSDDAPAPEPDPEHEPEPTAPVKKTSAAALYGLKKPAESDPSQPDVIPSEAPAEGGSEAEGSPAAAQPQEEPQPAAKPASAPKKTSAAALYALGSRAKALAPEDVPAQQDPNSDADIDVDDPVPTATREEDGDSADA